jgi:hypothetical protein
VVPPSGWDVTTPNPVFAAITKGDDFVTVDFGNVKHVRGGSTAAGSTTLTSATSAGLTEIALFVSPVELSANGADAQVPDSQDAEAVAPASTAPSAFTVTVTVMVPPSESGTAVTTQPEAEPAASEQDPAFAWVADPLQSEAPPAA